MPSPLPWPTAAPSVAGLDPAGLDRAEADLLAHFPDATSLLVARRGQLVFERYFGIGADEPQDTQSVTKSLVSLLTGMLVERGRLDVDRPVLAYLPHDPAGLGDARWPAVTVRHLLGMTSGLPSELTDPAYDDAWYFSADPLKFTLAQPLLAEPGQVFHYSNAGVHLLGAVLAEVAREPLAALMQRALLTPLGIGTHPWPTDPQGRAWGSGGLFLTPREMLAVGQLALQHGQWQGQPLVPAVWLARSTRPRRPGYLFMEGLLTYGWLWWQPGPDEPAGFYATGYGGQYIAVFPALELVVAMTGRVSGHPNHRRIIPELAAQALQ
ncbi:serine hydrolase [Deinococcus irradiatisoli]|uniref:Serine hydrolase n=1 Tax=Deinococcus irradiatisoli TaxID=2202254 RepID=A0A2Z3JVD5_9DEIO|nr:serine hydrolase domain-containing protein [Deinococcus irradiatisoli]AWN24444.1 serine hydrolase [Deinococcus irradiatisoli]